MTNKGSMMGKSVFIKEKKTLERVKGLVPDAKTKAFVGPKKDRGGFSR